MTVLIASQTTGDLPLTKEPLPYENAVVFDLDDTIFQGEAELLRRVLLRLPEGVDYTWTNRMAQNDPVVGEHLIAELEEAEFMRTTPIIPDRASFGMFLHEMQKRYPNTLFMFCTHRGYTLDAKPNTEFLFNENGISNFPGVYLNYNELPCKKTFLDHYLKIPYILFDDHPKYNGGENEKVDNIFLMDQPWNKEETAYTRLFDIKDIHYQIRQFLNK